MKLQLKGVEVQPKTSGFQPAKQDPNARLNTAKTVLHLLDDPAIAAAVEGGRPNPQSLLNTDIGDGRKAYTMLHELAELAASNKADADDLDNLVEIARVTRAEFENLTQFLNHRRDGRPYRIYDGTTPYMAAGFVDAFFMAEKKKSKALSVPEPTSPRHAAEIVIKFYALKNGAEVTEGHEVTEGSESENALAGTA